MQINSAEAYLETVEAEADCIIWLGKIDLHRESSESGGENDPEMKHLLAKAEEAFSKLKKLVSSHGQ